MIKQRILGLSLLVLILGLMAGASYIFLAANAQTSGNIGCAAQTFGRGYTPQEYEKAYWQCANAPSTGGFPDPPVDRSVNDLPNNTDDFQSQNLSFQAPTAQFDNTPNNQNTSMMPTHSPQAVPLSVQATLAPDYQSRQIDPSKSLTQNNRKHSNPSLLIISGLIVTSASIAIVALHKNYAI